MALTGQASAHFAQWIHNLSLKTTPPPFFCFKASVGQAREHGAGLQAKQNIASKPVLIPPEECICIPARFQEIDL